MLTIAYPRFAGEELGIFESLELSIEDYRTGARLAQARGCEMGLYHSVAQEEGSELPVYNTSKSISNLRYKVSIHSYCLMHWQRHRDFYRRITH